MTANTIRRACVLGHGIAYSRSPLIHTYWIKKYGLNAEYNICDLPEESLPGFVDSIRNGELAGCNVTIPYKQTVVRYLDEIDDAASTTGSVNTIYCRDGILRGTSTDGAGYLGHLKQVHPAFRLNNARVLILGAGGAARSIAHVLVKSGCSVIYVANRTAKKAHEIAGTHPSIVKALNWEQLSLKAGMVDLVINTTSLGMVGKQPLVFEVENTRPDCVISDIVYAPLETDLLTHARNLERPVLDGLGMLLHQAVPGFQLWFGVNPEVTGELRALIEQDLLSNG